MDRVCPDFSRCFGKIIGRPVVSKEPGQNDVARQKPQKLGVAGTIAAAFAAFAHGADDCARAGTRVAASSGDDIARIAPVGAGDDVARIAPVAQRPRVFGALPDEVPARSAGSEFADELAGHTLDAVDLLIEISDDAEQLQTWGPIGTPTYIALHPRSSSPDFDQELGAAKLGPPVFVIGQASAAASDAISLAFGKTLSVGAIQAECLSHGVGCVVLICGPEANASASCVARALAATQTAVLRSSRQLDRVLRELLHQRGTQRWDTLAIYRLADTPEGPRIVRSRPKGAASADGIPACRSGVGTECRPPGLASSSSRRP
jgi:hypothetical protein